MCAMHLKCRILRWLNNFKILKFCIVLFKIY